MSVTDTTIDISEPQLSLGERIRKARKEAGLNRRELALAIRVGYQTVGKWERDEQIPDVFEARDVAIACRVPFGWLTCRPETDVLRRGSQATRVALSRSGPATSTSFPTTPHHNIRRCRWGGHEG